MSKWPFSLGDDADIDDDDLDETEQRETTHEKVLRNARAELERSYTWGFEDGTPAADALRQVSIDAAMVVVQESLKFVQNDRAYGGGGFMFEPGAELVLTCWPIGSLETVQTDIDLEAVMTHHDIVVHERKQMTDMAACLRRIADRYEQAAEEIDWAAVAASFEGVARPFADGTIRPPGPFDEVYRMLAKEVAKGFADMPAPKS